MNVISATTANELASQVAKAVKLKQWSTFVGKINGKNVLLKVYGKWLQIFKVDGLDYSHPAFKTQKEMSAYIVHSIIPAFAAAADLERYFMKGNGIYNWTIGGRYFRARVTGEGQLQVYHGYESADNDGWIDAPINSDWRGPNGEKVYIHGSLN